MPHLDLEMTPELIDYLLSPPSDTSCSSPLKEHASPTTSFTLQRSPVDLNEEGLIGPCKPTKLGPGFFALESEDEKRDSQLPQASKSECLSPGTPPEIYLSLCGSPARLDLDSPLADGLDDPFGSQFDPFLDSLSPPTLDYHLPKSEGPISSPLAAIAFNLDATLHSPLFPAGHRLNPYFVQQYGLEDELGSGGYGFVMTARHRTDFREVAVKFIIKSKIPTHAWVEDEIIGRLPLEVMLLSFIEHENIVKCLDLFEDPLYFYLIQELHGSPWPKFQRHHSNPSSTSSACLTPSTPALSPSVSTSSLSTSSEDSPTIFQRPPERQTHKARSSTTHNVPSAPPKPTITAPITTPGFSKRPSYDLFECIEQSEHKRLSEKQARYVFSQVVDAVYYLDSQGITHRDIKDENILIDKDLRVKLIDFGSAAVVNPHEPRPYYSTFFGTISYASPEIILKKKYRAPPAEIWTLGVLLSFLLTGTSPFPTVKDATHGRIHLPDAAAGRLSSAALDLMRQCLDPDPLTRASIVEVKAHEWLA